jgi:hypothetical protein
MTVVPAFLKYAGNFGTATIAVFKKFTGIPGMTGVG